ncbi:metallophosphoesterase family protein [Sulfurimonas sp.]|uniref:metallophosphoesterase family protein n=1 Tax=Sulfurimonas sp. TaxID=2022749 RepID=UPI003D0BEBFA
MKIAIISDIHANNSALSAVLKDININKVDLIICLGDVATLGPSPREVIATLKKLNCPCIIGNHEEALFYPDNAEEYDIKGKLLNDTIYWCLDNIDSSDLNFLKKFESTKIIDLDNNKTMYCYHGTPSSTTGSIYSESEEEQLDKIFQEVGETIRIAVGGHTHVQMVRQYRNMFVVNPGSVGCAFKFPFNTPPSVPSLSPFAEYAIVESRDDNLSVQLKKVSYDIKEYITTLKNSTLPLKDWWLDEYYQLGHKIG